MNGLKQHIMAAYYNDARLNILASLNHIRARLDLDPLVYDEETLRAYEEIDLLNRVPEVQADIIKHLRNSFRFLDPVTDPSSKAEKSSSASESATPLVYQTKMLWAIEQINTFRNAMVHPTLVDITPVDLGLHKNNYFDLYTIYDAALDTVKERFGIPETEEVSLDNPQGSAKKDKLIIKPIIKPLRSWDPIQKKERVGKKTRKFSVRKSLKQFSLAITLDPKESNTKKVTTSNLLYDFGHVLFCSLFLDRHQSAELLNYFWASKHGTQWSSQQRDIIHEVVGIYRIYPPVKRLKSDHSETALTLDSLSELSRCPRRLFDVISEEDQKKFRIPISQVASDDDVSTIDNSTPLTTLYARSNEDRFIPLMMRYLDFDKQCKLRFAIDLGQLYYNVRLKPPASFTDHHSRVRRLSQSMTAYGRLSDFLETDVPAQWQQLEINAASSPSEAEEAEKTTSDEIVQLKPYWVRCTPHYHFYHDKIGLKLAQDDEESGGYPTLDVADVSQPVKLEAPSAIDMEPEFWVSPSQMMHLCFYHHLQRLNGDIPPIEEVLKAYQKGMRDLINTLAIEPPLFSGADNSDERVADAQRWVDSFFENENSTLFSVPLNELPKVVYHHLTGKGGRSLSVEEVNDRCRHLIIETEGKLNQIEFQRQGNKKRGKKGFNAIKCGHIGDFLTDDLMRFQQTDHTKPDGGKLNSQQYQILQASLAYYGAHIHEPPRIDELLKDCGLLGGEFSHPFLHKLKLAENPEKYPGLLSFYQDYLKERKRFLENYVNHLKQQQEMAKPPGWLRLRQRSTLETWLTEHQSKPTQPLPLPNKLFYPPLLTMVAKAIGVSSQRLRDSGGKEIKGRKGMVVVPPSIPWLIKQYLAHENDCEQAMYRLKRQHEVFDVFKDQRGHKNRYKPKAQLYFTEEERQGLLPKIRNKLKCQPTADNIEKLTKLLPRYKRQERALKQLSYQDQILYLYAKKHLTKLQLSEGCDAPDWSLKDLERTLLNTAIRYEQAVPNTDKLIFHPDCKVRNLGEVRLLARDRRLATLMAYYPEEQKELSQYEIRAELNSYGRIRVKSMALIHQLEKRIFQRLALPRQSYKEFEAANKSNVPKPLRKYFSGAHGWVLYLFYQQFEEKLEPSLETFRTTRMIRNAFSHSEYPSTRDFPNILAKVRAMKTPSDKENQHRKVANTFYEALEMEYLSWIKLLD